MWALNRRRGELAGLLTREEVIARVAAARPLQGWVIGQGWNANGWASPPHRMALDRVQQGPVCLDSLDVHAAWLNSAALATAGITRDTPDPCGGRIVRDATGDPTGLLLERAVELVAPHLPEPAAQVLENPLRDAQAEAHRLGSPGSIMWKAWQYSTRSAGWMPPVNYDCGCSSILQWGRCPA